MISGASTKRLRQCALTRTAVISDFYKERAASFAEGLARGEFFQGGAR
jgi:hypothetical protein